MAQGVLLQGIFCYIPIIHTMAEPQHAQGCAAVAVTAAASLYVATGLTGMLVCSFGTCNQHENVKCVLAYFSHTLHLLPDRMHLLITP